jgi:DNA mismatch repair ATPase MutS
MLQEAYCKNIDTSKDAFSYTEENSVETADKYLKAAERDLLIDEDTYKKLVRAFVSRFSALKKMMSESQLSIYNKYESYLQTK